MKQAELKCSICGRPYIGFGNNAQPINDGRCCELCNNSYVIPRRIIDLDMLKQDGVMKIIDNRQQSWWR